MNKTRYSATEFGLNKPMNFRPSGTLSLKQLKSILQTERLLIFTYKLKSYAWFNFTCHHPPPGQPRGQVQPFRPGGGEVFEAILSRVEGGGAN